MSKLGEKVLDVWVSKSYVDVPGEDEVAAKKTRVRKWTCWVAMVGALERGEVTFIYTAKTRKMRAFLKGKTDERVEGVLQWLGTQFGVPTIMVTDEMRIAAARSRI